MNLGQFRELTKHLPDDTPIMRKDYDHELEHIWASESKALKEVYGTYTEWYGDEHGIDSPNVFTIVYVK